MDILKEFITSFSPGQNGFFFMWILAGLAVAALLIAVDRWISIARQTNIDTSLFVDRLLNFVKDGKLAEAKNLCDSGKNMALPRVLGSGVAKVAEVPEMVTLAMEEESLHVIPHLENRLNLIVTFGNLATLIGLMGTIYGLILAFAAVAQPNVSPVEKSSMLAIGISAAMNTTLLGLVIAVPCVFAYSFFRARIDEAVSEIDRFAVAFIKAACPDTALQKSFRISSMRIREEVETEPNMVPFMNLMVVLIPLLLSSSEFVKLGMIELKLPESSQGGGGGGGGAEETNAKVDLGIVVTSKGFNLFHYFKKDSSTTAGEPEIPMVNGKYDFETLNKKVAEVKRQALYEIVRQANGSISPEMDLWKLQYLYNRNDFGANRLFADHENVKIVAEEKINYQTVVAVMDAARGAKTTSGNVTLFPNVSLAGGIIQ